MKDCKLSKKLISLLAAGMLMGTPVMGLAEGDAEVNMNDDEFVLLAQEHKFFPYDEEEFKKSVKNGMEYLKGRIYYDHMQQDFQCFEYLTNREYMPKETEEDLLLTDIIYETDVVNEKYENFVRSYNFISVVCDYNESTIRDLDNVIPLDRVVIKEYDAEVLNKYLKKVISGKDRDYVITAALIDYSNEIEKKDSNLVIEVGKDICLEYDEKLNAYLERVINGELTLTEAINEYNEALIRETHDKLIDASVFCYGEDDIKLVHDMFENWFNAYLAGKYDNKYFDMLYKQLTTLNAAEKAGNAKELSVGARWNAQSIIGIDTMQMLQDDLGAKYSVKELAEYFVLEYLNAKNFIPRDDKPLENETITSELEEEVFKFNQLWIFCHTNVTNDLFSTFSEECINIGSK